MLVLLYNVRKNIKKDCEKIDSCIATLCTIIAISRKMKRQWDREREREKERERERERDREGVSKRQREAVHHTE